MAIAASLPAAGLADVAYFRKGRRLKSTKKEPDLEASKFRFDMKLKSLQTKPEPAPSLINRIRRASSAREIDKLLAEGATYTHASDKTRMRWRVAAQWRRCQIVPLGL